MNENKNPNARAIYIVVTFVVLFIALITFEILTKK
jgi:hypothetical protein